MNKSRKFAALIIITIILMVSGTVAHAQEEDDEHPMYVERPKVFYGGAIVGVNFAQVGYNLDTI